LSSALHEPHPTGPTTEAAIVERMRAEMRLPPGTRVAVAMSGGVDSSTVAALLVEAGYEVVGLTARLYDEPEDARRRAGSCCAPRDAADARAVADALDIHHYVVDEREAFAEAVIARFAEDYRSARTPNPCVECNRSLKFDRLLRRALTLGAEALATGHYARLRPDALGRPQLSRGVDADKDQAYFLHPLRPGAANWLRFPLGGMDKTEVRAHATRLGVPVADKPESMDLCFTGGLRPADWVARHGGAPAGVVVDLAGTRLGRHDNLAAFTVGQRRGVPIPGPADRYVVEKRADGTIVVGSSDDLQRDAVTLDAFGTIDGSSVEVGARLHAQLRHRGEAHAARVVAADGERLALRFDAPVRAIAPGQSVVLFDGDRVVGGGLVVTEAAR
jgi:tRNA-specific 2-thiouridylase